MDRKSSWSEYSHRLEKHESYMGVLTQQLGNLDIELIELGNKHKPDNNYDAQVLWEFDKYMTLSYLWVLGAYEMVRTLSQRLKEKRHSDFNKVNQLKKIFERVRIPLAKMEPAKNYPDDFSIAWPANTPNEFGWQIGEGKIILRIDLSNKLLEMLASLS